MTDTPFADAVGAYLRNIPLPLSTPGHKRNPAFVGETSLLLSDVPFHGGAETLRNETGILEQAEALAAAAWGADLCRFTHNGSTHPNQALCLATTAPGEPVLVHRTCHKSVYAGLILAGARPVWLAPDVSDDLGIPLGTPAARVAEALDAEPRIRTAILTEPSYIGVLSDIPAIAAVCHERGVALICDHAWAAHFGFASSVPPNALTLGADAIALSTHKTLPSLTPGALLLARRSGHLDLEHLSATFDLLLTTSPSATIYASIDACRARMQADGEELLAAACALAERAREGIEAIAGLRVLRDDDVLGHPSVMARDPLKLAVDVSGAQADGIALDRGLRARGVQVEGADRRLIIPHITVGDDEARIDAFLPILRSAVEESRGDVPDPPPVSTSWQSQAEQAMTPREAFYARSETVSADRAAGRVAAEFAVPYPPGIPALAPGEVIGAELWQRLRAEAAGGARIAFAADAELQTFRVVATG
jgi:arginine decarboxylase